MRVEVDHQLCGGCGTCEAISPYLFKVTDGVSQVMAQEIPREAENLCADAVEECPNGALCVVA